MSVRIDKPRTHSRYQLGDPIGHGGMAVVYRAYDAELARVVAVKVLADNLSSDEALRERFLREARLAARLQHPNVVHVYDTGERGGRPFIVMEYVPGETLHERLAREGKLAPSEAVEFVAQACAGLEHAHRAGVVHRDIKPQNLLLREDGVLKIADFGIARSSQGTRLTEIGSILGTADYLAPEQAAGQAVTSAADLYALGVVLYQLLAGRTPYNYATLTQLLVGQHQQRVPPLRQFAPEVPPQLDTLVMSCLAREPGRRPPSAALLGHELTRMIRDLPTRMDGHVHTTTAPTHVATAATMPLYVPASAPDLPPAQYRSSFIPLGGKQLAIAVVVLASLVALIIALASGGDSKVHPSHGPARQPALSQAQDLSRWLRSHTH